MKWIYFLEERSESMNQVTVEGVVEKITYYNSENGYAVFSIIDNDDITNEITCVGYIPTVNQGESVKLTGHITKHHLYGEQVNIEIFEKSLPKSERAIELYLASGIIKGIGPRIAKKIIGKFGKDTLYILDNEPERLAEIRGISNEKAITIGELYKEKVEQRQAMLFLAEYGISPTYSLKIYKKYKDKTIEIVKKNPYSLAEDIIGIGFKIADSIASNVGIAKDSPFRIRAGVKYTLTQASNNGNVYLPLKSLLIESSELLGIDEITIENELLIMHIDNQIWFDNTTKDSKIYLNLFYSCENNIASKLYRLNEVDLPIKYNYDDEIDAMENSNNMHFAPQQRQAIKMAMENNLLVITGGPGTGKTTIINAIIKLCEAENLDIKLAAPTGRAAKRMEEATNHKSQTIHRLLELTFLNENSRHQVFNKNEENPIDADLIIIDESSMIDVLLMSSLLNAISYNTRLIIVGDSDQLPSIGAGNVLKDIISSEVIKVAKLTEIFRQAKESSIITNAHNINNGIYPNLNEKNSDFFFMQRNKIEEIEALIVSLVTDRLPKYLNCNPIKDIQVLTPMRKSPLGVNSLNTLLQKALNPPSENKREKELRKIIYREGDKVMQVKNNYNIEWKTYENGEITDDGVGIFNGDEGIITYIDTINEYIEVLFDDNKIVHYDYTQMDEVDLSYAVTIHKSQGSEYNAIIMPLLNGPDMLMSRNLLYTGLTRAKNLAVIAGSREKVENMVDNNKEVERYTTLKDKLIDYMNFSINN